MPTKRELLKSVREDFQQLEMFDRVGLKRVQGRAEMIVERVFGPDTRYIQRLQQIKFSPGAAPFAVSSSGSSYPSADTRRNEQRRFWLAAQEEAVAQVNIMLEKLKLDETGGGQLWEDSTGPKSNAIFVVHGHDNEMKLAVARTIERLGLEAIVLHEKPNRGQTIIEKIERYSDVGFAVVLLSPDDTGYSNADGSDAASPRARQNVILELGYFAGKLGRESVVALYRGDVELPSDYDGVLYTRYDSDSGTWRSELVAELKESGYEVSADNL